MESIMLTVAFNGSHRNYKIVAARITALGGWWIGYGGKGYTTSRFTVADNPTARETIKGLRNLGVAMARPKKDKTMLTERDIKHQNKIMDGVFEPFSRTITSDLIKGEYILSRGDGNSYLLGLPGHYDGPDSCLIVADENMSQLLSGDTLFWFMADAKELRKALRATKEEGKTRLS